MLSDEGARWGTGAAARRYVTTRGRSRSCALLMAAWCVLFAPLAAAGGTDGADLFRSAQMAFSRGEHVRAAELFEQARHHAKQEPAQAAALYNAGRAWQQAGEMSRACTAYHGAIDIGGLPPVQVDDARLRRRALGASLLGVRLRGPSDVVATLGHQRNAPLPLTVCLSPGEHRVTLTGGDGRSAAVAVAGAAGEIVSVPVAQLLAAMAPRPLPDAPPASPSVLPVAGWIALGVATSGGIATAALGALGLAAKDRYLESELTDLDAYEDAKGLRVWTNVALVGSISLALVGITLLWVAPDTDPKTKAVKPSAALRISVGQVRAIVRF